MKQLSLRILVVDDEAAQREILADILIDVGHEVRTAANGGLALEALVDWAPDLLLTDLRMPGIDGVELLRRARERIPRLTVILMTAHATVASAVEAMQGGAYDYLQKPFRKEELLLRVSRVGERIRLLRENRRLRRELHDHTTPLFGESAVMQQLLARVDRVAAVSGDVLITGESGTGKELVARRVHADGPRSGGPFVALNCAAIPEGVADSELFGHERGAFTSATSSRAGKFEQADGGTLFLDEISSMPLSLQAKLLRVVQEREVERVGGSGTRRVDVRLVAATNRDLSELTESGEFRKDLYHRLNVLELHLPPLRERGDDVIKLAERFRDEAGARFGLHPPRLGDDLCEFLKSYAFPGNVRELKHLMEKMVVLCESETLGLGDLPASMKKKAVIEPRNGSPLPPEELLASGGISLQEVEDRLIREAIRQSGGNLSEAARRLGLSYKTLRYRAGKLPD